MWESYTETGLVDVTTTVGKSPEGLAEMEALSEGGFGGGSGLQHPTLLCSCN
uniref:Uncharacterized protein n=1 Tax=Physcomitrium patens TaxID=3218 RepID=A0A2K1II16_PHYPA|nr:hypothetical protein PHYPA_027600 [Physcomitrium patens]